MKKRSIFKYKGYAHFDIKKGYSKYEKRIKDPSWISKHGFYPFVHFTIKFKKYNGKKIKLKNREIYYSAHIDRYIYQYYADILNNIYNEKAKSIGINKVAIAYRNNFKNKCNIHLAKEVIDFICNEKEAFIYIGDFSKFFDKLDHEYLKDKLKEVLSVSKLPDDYYAVYKNITKYTYIEFEDIKKLKKMQVKDINKEGRLFETNEFQILKKKYLKKNEEKYGIPQGAAISAVCSNLYMMDFDKKINNYVTSNNGVYRRYCDDVIIVIPILERDITNEDYNKHLKVIDDIKNSIPNLILNEDKTSKFYYKNCAINSIDGNINELDYLGFSFDGKTVKIREKSIFKYYSRLYKKINVANRYTKKYNKNSFRKRIFKLYSHLGSKPSKNCQGNFITYVKRAQDIFDKNRLTDNKMIKQVKRHWKIIDKNLYKIDD